MKPSTAFSADIPAQNYFGLLFPYVVSLPGNYEYCRTKPKEAQ